MHPNHSDVVLMFIMKIMKSNVLTTTFNLSMTLLLNTTTCDTYLTKISGNLVRNTKMAGNSKMSFLPSDVIYRAEKLLKKHCLIISTVHSLRSNSVKPVDLFQLDAIIL